MFNFAIEQLTLADMRGPFTLEELKAEMEGCRKCPLSQGRTNIVFGEGNPAARLMFIGEGPGAEEDRQGRPFVGAAGQLLDRILAAAGMSREEVYIANVVKCRPPGNRVPTPAEAEACMPWLKKQFEIIVPRLVVLLGSTALQYLVDSKARITQCRGQWIARGDVRIMPTYHPAALLRDPSKKRPVWEDIQKVRDLYRQLGVGS